MKCEVIRRISQGTIENEINQLTIIPSGIKNNGIIEEDYLIKTIGAFGLWQAVISVTVTLARAISVWNMVSTVFLTPTTEFNCVEFSNNVSFEVKNDTCYDNCLRYNHISTVENNIIEDFDLICEDAWLASFAQFILMLGVLLGVLFFGWISDSFGRRPALLISTAMNSVFMIGLSFAPNIIIFCCIRFMIGIATGGTLTICVIHVLEMFGKRHREIAGACAVLPDGIAQASLAGFAYFTWNWQSYTLSYGVATCIIFIFMIFVPESPRWLVSQGKVDDAVKVITSAAKRNKLDTSNIKTVITKVVEDIYLQEQEAVKTSYIDFFKTKKAFMTLTIFVMWFGLGMCFYGIYQYATVIGMNPYSTMIVLGLAQLPLCPLEIILNKTFGRKISIIGAMCVVGVTIIIQYFVHDSHWLSNLLGVIGFTSAGVAYTIAYVHVAELYPTPLRNKAYGISSGGARVGSMVAPIAADLMPSWVPSVVFGIMPLITIFCCVWLPETKGRELEDAIDD